MHGPSPGLAGPDPKRQAILRAARSDFVLKGFADTKIEPIARRAGVSTATLYALFSGKDDLFAAVIEDAAEDFARQMAGVRAIEGDARAQLTSFGEAYAGFMSDPFVRSVFRLVMAERPRFQSVALGFFEHGQREFGATLICLIKTLCDRGELGPVDHPSWAAGAFMGMVEHPVFFVPLVTGDEVRVKRTIARIVADAVDTFLARWGPPVQG